MSSPTHHRTSLRGAVLVVLGMVVALSGLTVAAPPAHAGQLGLTIHIQGAGRVDVVSGSLEDDGPTVCDWTSNRDDRVVNDCPRIRNQEAFEAWVWLKPTPAAEPEGEWVARSWDGCDRIEMHGDVPWCGVGSGAFSSDEKHVRANFVDRRQPTVTRLTSTRAESGDPTWTYEFAADDGDLECGYDTISTWVPCTSPLTHTWSEGQHTLSVRATDASGNTSVVRSSTEFVIETYLDEAPPARTASRTARFVVRTGIGREFRCSLDDAPATWCAGEPRAELEHHGLADGPHTLRVQALWGESVDPTPVSHRWVVDTTAPLTSITGARTQRGTARFDFAADGAASYQCRLDAGAWSTCASPATYDGLVAGQHRFQVRASDDLGNLEEAGASHEWVVTAPSPPGTPAPGTTAPDTGLRGGPKPGSVRLRRSATFAATGTGGSVGFRCTVDGAARPCPGGRLALRRLSAGTHRVTAAAVDAAGTLDATPVGRTWTVPLDDRALTAAGAWKRSRSARAYLRSALVTQQRGARVTARVRGARGLAVVAGPGRGGGKVVVHAGRRRVGTLVLPSARSARVMPVIRLARTYSGKIRITVVSAGRPVRLDGLGVLTS